jgi:hypothetical protein
MTKTEKLREPDQEWRSQLKPEEHEVSRQAGR